MTTLPPGFIRALAWVAEQHPNENLSFEEFRDGGDVGWMYVRVDVATGIGNWSRKEYVVSPIGRVFYSVGYLKGEVARDADYATA